MIIKNMEGLGRAIDAGEDFEISYLSDDWDNIDVSLLSTKYVSGYINDGRIRVKPKTFTLYEYQRTFRGAPMWSTTPPSMSNAGTGRTIINGVITEEMQK